MPQAAISQNISVTNSQTQNAPITSSQTENVAENYGLLQKKNGAVGNLYTGGNDDVGADLSSTQTNSGTIFGTTTVNSTNVGDQRLSVGTPLYLDTEAYGNALEFTTNRAPLNVVTVQDSTAVSVRADTQLNANNAAVYDSGELRATSKTNYQAIEIKDARLDASTTQTSTTESRARSGAVLHYSPSNNHYQASAYNNDLTAYASDNGSQEHHIVQNNSGRTESYVSFNGGNVWNPAVTSSATANHIALENEGGSLVATARQTQHADVVSQAIHTQYEWSKADTTSLATGNVFSAVNNDIYLRVDLEQTASGGVSSHADFVGHQGYDAYTTAESVGNFAHANACANCAADVEITSSQVNNANINAHAVHTITGQARSSVTKSRAVGNSATYYVTGNTH